jgi:hypothetical protein
VLVSPLLLLPPLLLLLPPLLLLPLLPLLLPLSLPPPPPLLSLFPLLPLLLEAAVLVASGEEVDVVGEIIDVVEVVGDGVVKVNGSALPMRGSTSPPTTGMLSMISPNWPPFMREGAMSRFNSRQYKGVRFVRKKSVCGLQLARKKKARKGEMSV